MQTDWDAVQPWWLPGGNAQTIWPALYARRVRASLPHLARERWVTPDGDFVDVDAAVNATPVQGAPLLVLFHGLEGSSASHYAQAFGEAAVNRGWGYVVPHFRGCSGEINLAPRAYHSGDHVEIDWLLRQVARRWPGRRLVAVGVSLGGNALLRWVQEQGSMAHRLVAAVAAVSAPVDLAAAGRAIDQGFNRWVYARMFLKTMVRKAEAKWTQFPGLFDLEAVRSARTIHAFDNLFTAPLHGFKSTEDYWARAAAKPGLRAIQLPTLVLNAYNDPFVPGASLPGQGCVGDWVTLWQPRSGGHVGFARPVGRWGVPGQVWSMPAAVTAWLSEAGGLQHG